MSTAEEILLDLNAETNDQWRAVMEEKLRTAHWFEIHCWKEERDEIALALPWGKTRESSWDYGVIIEGPVTEPFRSFLLGLPKPTDTELCNKMTPFFSVFLDNGFYSEHYGTELNQENRQ